MFPVGTYSVLKSFELSITPEMHLIPSQDFCLVMAKSRKRTAADLRLPYISDTTVLRQEDVVFDRGLLIEHTLS